MNLTCFVCITKVWKQSRQNNSSQ